MYDFFRKVYAKLTADLKVPFQLQGGQRVDDTPVHESLREALTNTLIHADYSGRVSVLVVRRPDLFGFRNPGRMRVPMALAIQGGNSDCRNRRLQTMFQLALITAQVEGVVSHDRMKQICTDHPADLTKMLGTLVREGFLVPQGAGRGMVYLLLN